MYTHTRQKLYLSGCITLISLEIKVDPHVNNGNELEEVNTK